MGRTGTWLVAAAVGALAAVAALDAVLGRGDEPPAGPSGPAQQERAVETELAAEALRAQSVYGTLLYADHACSVHALALPDLVSRAEPGAPTGERGCRFTTAPGGSFAVGDAAPRPGSDLRAVCARGRILVGTADGIVVGEAPGCAPAWKPNGDLTGVDDGALVDVRFAPRQEDVAAAPRVLISRADLRRVFAGPPWAFAAPAVREAVWLDDERVALVVADRASGEEALAVFEGTRLVGGPPAPYERLSRLRASPRGSYVAALVGNLAGAVVVDREGELVSFPFRGARAVAWSPDEVWTAAATRDAVYVFATGERPSRFARLPIAASDVVWR